jgi:hypothetical protein
MTQNSILRWKSSSSTPLNIGLPQPLERDDGHLPAQALFRMCRAMKPVPLRDTIAHQTIEVAGQGIGFGDDLIVDHGSKRLR